jgi:hypothetical protein
MVPASQGGVLPSLLACTAQQQLPVRRLLLPLLALSAVLLIPEAAGACGATPSLEYTITSVSPVAEASGVALDTGIIINGISCSANQRAFSGVALIDVGTGERRSLLGSPWSGGTARGLTLAYYPSNPLEPQHQYRLEATHIDLPNGPDETREEVEVSTFTTSDAVLEPLVLSDELELSLRSKTVVSAAVNDCPVSDVGGDYDGCFTPPMITGRALVADVKLPAPSGGQGIYNGVLHFSDRTPPRVSANDPRQVEMMDDEPHRIHRTWYLNLTTDQTLTLPQELGDERFSYAGCFTFVVWDPGMHVTQTSTCLPSLSPDDIQALAAGDTLLPLSTDPDVAFHQLHQALGDDRDAAEAAATDGSSCSLRRSHETNLPTGLALLLTCLGLRRRSRYP